MTAEETELLSVLANVVAHCIGQGGDIDNECMGAGEQACVVLEHYGMATRCDGRFYDWTPMAAELRQRVAKRHDINMRWHRYFGFIEQSPVLLVHEKRYADETLPVDVRRIVGGIASMCLQYGERVSRDRYEWFQRPALATGFERLLAYGLMVWTGQYLTWTARGEDILGD